MQWSDLFILVPSLIGFWVLVRRRFGKVQILPPGKVFTENAIVVDRSNAMHWGDGASALVLSRVLRSLEEKGYHPIVFFDANVGYVLDDRYYDAVELSRILDLPESQIYVVSKGIVADEAILTFASDHGLRVVTNDRFRDWRVRFPHAGKKGILLGGTWREGAIVWRGTL